MRFMKIFTIVNFIFITVIYSAYSAEVKVTSLYGKVIKGKSTDYYPDIFSKYKLITAQAFTYSGWSGETYISKQYNTNIEDGTTFFVSDSISSAEKYGLGYCQEYLASKGINNGFMFIDNFEFINLQSGNGTKRYIVSGNVMCFTNK